MGAHLSCFLSWSGEFNPKIFFLVLGEMLGVFVNTLTVVATFPLEDCENLQLPIKLILSKKQENFSGFSIPILESTSTFKHFEKRMIVIANAFAKLENLEILLRPIPKKCRFRTRFDSKHVKASQIIAKSPWEAFSIFFHHSRRGWYGKSLPQC